jgi:hypothetical protein
VLSRLDKSIEQSVCHEPCFRFWRAQNPPDRSIQSSVIDSIVDMSDTDGLDDWVGGM